VNKNNRRVKMSQAQRAKRAALKAVVMNKSLPIEERLQAQMKLSALPRNGAPSRIRNRCEVTGRARSVYRKFKLSRIKLREYGSFGRIPGLIKSSW
jgi:small subunit ribosomal protein S14